MGLPRGIFLSLAHWKHLSISNLLPLGIAEMAMQYLVSAGSLTARGMTGHEQTAGRGQEVLPKQGIHFIIHVNFALREA